MFFFYTAAAGTGLLATLLLIVTAFIFSQASGAATFLPIDEVEALTEIGKTLGKTDWNFSADPCSGEWGWGTQVPVTRGYENAVTCNCSFSNNSTLCHVVSIVLKAQNLAGKLPPELIRLPYLQEIDLTRNYLNGTLPPEWGSSQLVNISISGNRFTGSIPKEFGNIKTLTSLTLEYNQLSGAIPPELGNLPRIERIFLDSNNLTGKLPGELAKLTTLKEFRISDNHFTGKIPDFLQNWTNLQKLVIQGSGLDGPIPSGIAVLTKLSDLRISDLSRTETTFPPLSNLKDLETLILRSCNIIGQLPEYLGAMEKLEVLDLSFNKLSGHIPSSFIGLSNTDYVYLSGNLLSGPIPDWMLKEGNHLDLSYNNLTSGSPRTLSCQQQSVNLFGSSSKSNTSEIVTCLRSFQCPQYWNSFHINCGGREVNVDGNTRYEEDKDSGGPSRFFQSRTNWAFSSTGHFMDDEGHRGSYIWPDTSRLYVNNSNLYMDARLSPLSLTYYGFCLLNGNYKVRLHFAEIMFTDDKTYRSLGRRIFDVYIEGKLVLKNFNIEEEAGGVGKEIIKTFTTAVTNNTLEFQFIWSGKGTTGIPFGGVYGPLISAISVDPEFILPSIEEKSISPSTFVGIVVALGFSIFLLVGILWWTCCLRRNRIGQDLKDSNLHSGSLTLKHIKDATNNFDAANKIGEGGFGPVYKGTLSDGSIIAVKQLSSKSKQGKREFVNEIGIISALKHPHLVKLYGCCTEGNQLLLVYEYMENNCLARALFGPNEKQLKLDWQVRHKICIGIARGLAYLHEESRLKIVHRDIKATNVLLDKNLDPKISDFGLAKLDEEDESHISTRIAGTFGYIAPEYAARGYLTHKADVYSFGIVTLEIVSGRSNSGCRMNGCFCLLDWALELKEKGKLMELVDTKLEAEFNEEDVMVMINVAMLCTNDSPAIRPSMSLVVRMLESKEVVLESVSSVSNAEKTKNQHLHGNAASIGDSLIRNTSSSFTSSGENLYPINRSISINEYSKDSKK